MMLAAGTGPPSSAGPSRVDIADRSKATLVFVRPVPAIISADTFDRVAARLADNRRFASRNSTIPSLLQGPRRVRRLRLRVLPHLHPHHQEEDLLLPLP